MDICGESLHITRSHVMKLAQQGGIDARWAGHKLDAILAVTDQWASIVESFDIRRATRQKMHHEVIRQREALMR
jgi:serine/threonine-protein kinase HipA